MKKQFLSLLLSVVLLIGIAACAGADALYTAGVYQGAAKGMGGDVPVTVEFSESAIVNITVGDNLETKGLGTIPLETMPAEIIEKQSLAIDLVSGATISSTALLDAVKSCVEQAGGDVEALMVKTEDEAIAPAEDEQVDFIVVGGGAAGLTAGIHAKYNGIENVILLEKLSFCGGSSALSGGVLTRSSIEGDPEGTMTADEMFDYFYSISGGKVPDENLRQYAEESPELWTWFNNLEGVTNVVRYHEKPDNVYATWMEGRQGRGVVEVLMDEAARVGVDIRTSHDVTSLIQDEGGKVIGVKCTNSDGAEQNFYADAVLLATGGFANSEELLVRFAGVNAGTYVERKGAGGADGDGILMGEAVGAALHFGDNWDTSGMNNKWITTVNSFYLSELYGILVDDEAQRFFNEETDLPRFYENMVNHLNAGHTGGFHVIMTMEGFLASGDTQEDIDKAVELGEIVKCDTIEALAEQTGLDAEALRETITTYAGLTEDPFGKEPAFLGKLNPEGPFYTAKTHPVRSGTMGGLMINTKAEVLDTKGNPIPGLLGAGETANSTFFDNYYYIGGNMLTHALITGRAAGNTAAELCK